jgi:hypothetical protein
VTVTCTIAAAGYSAALVLVVHGLLAIADKIDEPCVCRVTIATGLTEILGGVVLVTGLLAMTGGYI